ncbi:hypothetical protein J3R83DRAFT_3888 [Lanmaoa asiatica]|nr:hypothetical protein J3R83DRAFT_3888 [Lanmaoa asiatica]
MPKSYFTRGEKSHYVLAAFSFGKSAGPTRKRQGSALKDGRMAKGKLSNERTFVLTGLQVDGAPVVSEMNFCFTKRKVQTQLIWLTLFASLGSAGSHPHNNPRQEPVRSSLVKQTYSVYVDTSRGRRKWHLIAYFTADTADDLRTVSEIPELARLNVPPGKYRSARHPPRHRVHRDEQGNHAPSHQQFPPYPSPTRLSNQVSQGTMRLPVPSGVGPCGPTSLEKKGQTLAPLVYLQNLPPPRRHPVDEEILMTLYPSLT